MTDISVLIPYRDGPGRHDNFMRVMEWHMLPGLEEAEIVVADSNEDEPFNRSQARNRAASLAHGDVFVFNDADSTLDSVTQLEHAAAVAERAGWVIPYDSYWTLDEGGSKDKEFPSPSFPEESVGGCLVVARWAFERVHGWDERFRGWGEEDRAFAMALETLVNPVRRVSGIIYHHWHPHPESERFQQPDFMFNRVLCNRYRHATHDVSEMVRLVEERPDWQPDTLIGELES